MTPTKAKLKDSLPFRIDWPEDEKKRRQAKMFRIAIIAAILAGLIAPLVQTQVKTLRNERRNKDYYKQLAAGTLSEAQLEAGPPKPHVGAVNRWRVACLAMWRGQNIYYTPDQYLAWLKENDLKNTLDRRVCLHPNMPFVVILLSPFAFLPISVGGLIYTILKVVAILLGILAVADVVSHKGRKIPDWVLALGIAWCILFWISDIQHVNTNGFVFAFIAGHLWAYRRGKDYLAGGLLTVAICIKMTPALFILYWIYQRNWKLLLGSVVWGILLAGVLPAVLLGPGHFIELVRTWSDNLIFKGLGGEWYPIHVNQSIFAVISRYLLGGHPGGDIEWNSDDCAFSSVPHHRWIAFASLDPQTVKTIIKCVQLAFLLLGAWAIGLKKLARDDARRALGYGVVVTLMLLLNQRSWDHHAAPLLIATTAGWYAIAFGRTGPRVRKIALGIMIAVGLILYLGMGELLCTYGRLFGMNSDQADDFSRVIEAWGVDFWAFVGLFAAMVLLAVKLRKSDDPYADRRMKLGE